VVFAANQHSMVGTEVKTFGNAMLEFEEKGSDLCLV
jgi:hypothetical protein